MRKRPHTLWQYLENYTIFQVANGHDIMLSSFKRVSSQLCPAQPLQVSVSGRLRLAGEDPRSAATAEAGVLAMLAAAGLQARNSAANVLMRFNLCWSLFWRGKENHGALRAPQCFFFAYICMGIWEVVHVLKMIHGLFARNRGRSRS